ncbi:MAG: ArgE/DapE family deacylase [Clostridia bacterium]
MIERLKQTLERNRDAYLKPLTELVAIDTHCLGHGVAGGLEKGGQDYMAELLSRMGATVRRAPMAEQDIQAAMARHHEGNPNHNYDGRDNVYGRFPGAGGRSLLFNGHMDTMPAGNQADWTYNPHTPTISGGKLYGLGACDMKGGLVAAVMAVQLLKDAGIPLPGDVHIASVADEEGGGNGSIAAAMQGVKADAVVVCECSDRELIAAHMGFVFFRVEVVGQACHSGAKWLGVSAIEKATALIDALNALEHRWLLRYKHPLLPAPNLNVGVIRGGTAGSTVAGECLFEVCVHYLPGVMNHDQVVREFREAIDWAANGDPWLATHRPRLTVYQSGGAFEMDLEHPFTRAFCDAISAVQARPAKVVGSPAGCDSRVWRNIAGCPTLQYGPGALAQCHAVNEYVPLADYYDAILTYACLILAWGNP